MRVDADVLQPSRYRLCVMMACYAIVAALWLLSPFAWSLKIGIFVLLGIGVAVATLRQHRPPVCVSVYQRDDGGWQWQMQGHDRWIHGQLQRVLALPYVLVLVFDCTAIKQQQRIVVWQDQVDRSSWRRLQVVAAWAGQRPSFTEG